jgi:hypothetical protein
MNIINRLTDPLFILGPVPIELEGSRLKKIAMIEMKFALGDIYTCTHIRVYYFIIIILNSFLCTHIRVYYFIIIILNSFLQVCLIYKETFRL